MYKLTSTTSILRTADNASIPADPANRDYAQYLEWLDKGNTPEAYVEPVVPIEVWRENATVSAFQAQQALDDFGYIEQVEAIMTDASTPAKTKRAWRLAQEFRRMSPTVLDLAGALGLSDVEVDALFQHALTIEA